MYFINVDSVSTGFRLTTRQMVNCACNFSENKCSKIYLNLLLLDKTLLTLTARNRGNKGRKTGHTDILYTDSILGGSMKD